MSDYSMMLQVDCPDIDTIRVDDTYYMLSTSMHFFPGCEILKSKNLVDWDHAAYVYERLDSTPAQRLADGNIYGAGMWAASFRYHNGLFYICFAANDTHKTYLYRSRSIEGPWSKSEIEGFYHDSSLLFDDDGKVYIAYGHRQIYITELNDDLSAPRPGGFHKLVINDTSDSPLGYEGTHLYKINGKYYLFFIHSVCGRWFRTEACYISDSLDGDWIGGDVFADDNGYKNAGIAQGCIVDTPEGEWYAMLFQDRGGSGRIPYLIPMHFEGDKPVIGDNGRLPAGYPFLKKSHNKGIELVGSDDFSKAYDKDSCFGFAPIWQFNHEPDMNLVERIPSGNAYYITTDKVCSNPTEASNSLTQRMSEPGCAAEITVDLSKANVGDIAGLCALQYLYGMIGLKVEEGGFSIVYAKKDTSDTVDDILSIASVNVSKARFRIEAQFGENHESRFYYDIGEGFTEIPYIRDMPFKLEHFCGYRFALVFYSTEASGGKAKFSDFVYYKGSD